MLAPFYCVCIPLCISCYIAAIRGEGGDMALFKSVDRIIGNTPLLELSGFKREYSLDARVLAKLEYFNPSGSVKDRVALAMIRDAEEKGILREGGVIIEPTSGNTGIGLAALAAAKGYKLIVTMPSTMSAERIAILRAYGAEVVLTNGATGMGGAIARARELANAIPNSFIPNQFANPSGVSIHRQTTGPEIWRDTQGNLDFFVAGVGTGGTLTGAGEYLKSKNPNIKVIAVEPLSARNLSMGESGAHKIQGIGAGFIPPILNTDICDGIIAVDDNDAFDTARRFAKAEGILVGISSGAALWAAAKLAEEESNRDKSIVVILPDGGDRYFSTPLFGV